MRISDWSSDVCSSDLAPEDEVPRIGGRKARTRDLIDIDALAAFFFFGPFQGRTLPVTGHEDDTLAHAGEHALLDIARLRRRALDAAVSGRRGRRSAHARAERRHAGPAGVRPWSAPR